MVTRLLNHVRSQLSLGTRFEGQSFVGTIKNIKALSADVRIRATLRMSLYKIIPFTLLS